MYSPVMSLTVVLYSEGLIYLHVLHKLNIDVNCELLNVKWLNIARRGRPNSLIKFIQGVARRHLR